MHGKKSVSFFLIFLVFVSWLHAQGGTAVLCAMPEEIAEYDHLLEHKKVVDISGVSFTVGRYKGRNVVLGLTGVGKVNAAITTSLLIQRFHPSRVVFTGIAGGLNPSLQVGDIVVADSVTQHDFGTLKQDQTIESWGVTNPLNNKRNPVFYIADAALIEAARQTAEALQQGTQAASFHVRNGIIATGDLFISSTAKKNELVKRLHADAVEMEGGAAAQVCYQFGVPFLIIRSISDGASDSAPGDFERFKYLAAQHAGLFVSKVLERLPVDTLVKSYRKAELYFGLSEKGRLIPEARWQRFLDHYITPKFPNGLTVVNARGQWLDDKVIKEPSKLLILVFEDTEENAKAILSIREEYCRQFNQQSVMQVDEAVEAVRF